MAAFSLHEMLSEADTKLWITSLAQNSELRNLAAFLPEQNVGVVFEDLLESRFYTENEEALLPILNYFDDTWIGRYNRRALCMLSKEICIELDFRAFKIIPLLSSRCSDVPKINMTNKIVADININEFGTISKFRQKLCHSLK